jgi:hypothetical protein
MLQLPTPANVQKQVGERKIFRILQDKYWLICSRHRS